MKQIDRIGLLVRLEHDTLNLDNNNQGNVMIITLNENNNKLNWFNTTNL